MPPFQFKLRSVFWLMTAVAVACVVVPAVPLFANRFMNDARDRLVVVALGLFIVLAVSRKWTSRIGEKAP